MMQWPNIQTKLSQTTKRKEAIKDRIAKTGQKPKAIVRVALDQAGIEARPVWKPMHKQPVYASAPAYVNGDVRYIVETIKASINNF